MPFKTVLYASKAQRQRATYQLRTLVLLARVANERNDITSVLRFDGHNYMQLIEGPTKAVDHVMARIAMDKRHSKLMVLSDERRPERSYVGFPMTYLYNEKHCGLLTEVVEGKRVLSGIEIRGLVLDAPVTDASKPV